MIRHFYNAYLAMDLKFEVYAIDYVRMTSYYVIYLIEYLYSLILVITTLPFIKYVISFDLIRRDGILQKNMPNYFNFDFDY